MGNRLQMHVGCAGSAFGRRPGADGTDSQAATFGDAGDQPAANALCVSCRADCVSFEAFRRREVDDTDDAAEKAGGLISGIRRDWFSPFAGRLLVKSAAMAAWVVLSFGAARRGCGCRFANWFVSGPGSGEPAPAGSSQ